MRSILRHVDNLGMTEIHPHSTKTICGEFKNHNKRQALLEY